MINKIIQYFSHPTVKIPIRHKKQLKARFDYTNLVRNYNFVDEVYEIEIPCPLCLTYSNCPKKSTCSECPFHKYDQRYTGCDAFIHKAIKDKVVFSTNFYSVFLAKKTLKKE